jgi:type II secretory pathway component GspD/PulD (secretin)
MRRKHDSGRSPRGSTLASAAGWKQLSLALALCGLAAGAVEAQAPPGGLPGGAGGSQASFDTLRPRGYRLLIRDRSSNLDAIKKILEEHDKAPREVRIESYVLSVELDQNQSSGVDLDFFFGPNKEDMPLGEYSTAGAMRSAGANQQFRFGSLSTERFQIFLDFLKRNTKTKVLSRPMLTVIDGGTASINIGNQIPYTLTTVVPGVAGGSPVQGTQIAFSSVGINLTFTPTIMSNDIVRMSISPEISDVSGQAAPNSPPPTRTQRVNTTLFVKDKHAFLIGGLYRVDNTETGARLPLLGNLPIIGDYLGQKTTTKAKKELVIVVKPTITAEEDFDVETKSPKKS